MKCGKASGKAYSRVRSGKVVRSGRGLTTRLWRRARRTELRSSLPRQENYKVLEIEVRFPKQRYAVSSTANPEYE